MADAATCKPGPVWCFSLRERRLRSTFRGFGQARGRGSAGRGASAGQGHGVHLPDTGRTLSLLQS